MKNTRAKNWKLKFILFSLLCSLIMGTIFVIPSKAISNISVSFLAPYSGNYLVATNTSTNLSDSQETGFLADSSSISNNLINQQPSQLSEEKVIVAIDDINGQKMYRYETKLIKKSTNDANKIELLRTTLNSRNIVTYSTNQTKNFSVIDNYDSSQYIMTAKVLYSGTYCTVWGDTSNVAFTTASATQIGKEYDNKIYSKMDSNFGQVKDTDGDGKLAIVCYNIRDDYYHKIGNSYIAGYFYASDMLPAYQGGNGMDMINIDTYPLMRSESSPDVTKAFSAIAHEMQHAICYTDDLNSNTQQQELELWLNEGLSMAAEHMIYGPLVDRIKDYNNYSSNINKGLPVIYNNYFGDDGSILAGYSQSYLFIQYLRVQTQGLPGGGEGIYKTILNSDKYDYRAISDVLLSMGYGINFQTFLRNFKIALFINEPIGPYGFMGDNSFNSMRTQLYTGTSALLSGGGGSIVKRINSPVSRPLDAGTNIQFAGVYVDSSDGTPTAEITFSDLNNVAWARDAIISLEKAGVINGYDDGTFKPENSITRAEFATMLVLAFNVYDPDAKSKFTDVPLGKWYNSYVASAEKEGLAEGVGDGKFLPEATMTREEMFTFSARAIVKYKGYELLDKDSKEINKQLGTFVDGNTVSDWAKEYVATVIKYGMVTGAPVDDSKAIYPQNAITRAEVAVVLYRAIVSL